MTPQESLDRFAETLVGEGPAKLLLPDAHPPNRGPMEGQVPLTPVIAEFFEANLPDTHHWNQSDAEDRTLAALRGS